MDRAFGVTGRIVRLSLFLVGSVLLVQEPAASAAFLGHDDQASTLKCMQTGMETKPDCRKPMPPCPLVTKVTAPQNPLVMLPNGVCGMLVDGGTKKAKN